MSHCVLWLRWPNMAENSHAGLHKPTRKRLCFTVNLGKNRSQSSAPFDLKMQPKVLPQVFSFLSNAARPSQSLGQMQHASVQCCPLHLMAFPKLENTLFSGRTLFSAMSLTRCLIVIRCQALSLFLRATFFRARPLFLIPI